MIYRVLVGLLGVLLIAGCDSRDSSSSSSTSAPPPAAPAAQETPPTPPPAVVATPTDPVADFKKFAAVFVDELFMQGVGKVQPKKDFTTHMYKKESAHIDVRKTDSLITPVVGTVQIDQGIAAVGFDSGGKEQAMIGGTATDTFNFSLDGTEWKYINGHSTGKMSKQDIRDVSLSNRQGLSSSMLDEDLSRDPRILRVVEATKVKVKRQDAEKSGIAR